MKFALLLCVLIASSLLNAQNGNSEFSSPLPGPTVLSGSFGEPRTKHFHAGIDFKPQRGWGLDSLKCVADGFVSRIVVSPEGYGNALYIEHPNGYTSVYAHLKEFAPEIRRYIEQVMYKNRVYRINHFPKRKKLPVSKGHHLGIMGNTGRSSGPHLHFELRKTDGQIPVNPFQFGIKPTDNRPPTIRGIIIYSLSPDDQVMHQKYIPAIKKSKNQWVAGTGTLKTGAVLVGIGIHTYDTMDGASNHNGIYGISTYVDGRPAFSFQLDEVNFSQTKYLHTHMDYAQKLENKYVTKCFRESFNPLPFYETDEKGGKIEVYEHIPRNVTINVNDFHDNVSTITFSLTRSAASLNVELPKDNTIKARPAEALTWTDGQNTVLCPQRTFITPVDLSIEADSSGSINLKQDHPIPIFESISLSSICEFKDDKIVYASLNTKGEITNHGGKWTKDQTFTTTVSSLDSFFLAMDTIAPSIEWVKLPGLNQDEIVIKVKDNFLGGSSDDQVKFTVLLDNEWLLCSYDLKSNQLKSIMNGPRRNTKHELVVRAWDTCGNHSEQRATFVF